MLLFRIKMSKCDSSCLVSHLNLSQCQGEKAKIHLLWPPFNISNTRRLQQWRWRLKSTVNDLRSDIFKQFLISENCYAMVESTVGGFSWQICTKLKQYYAKRLHNDLSVFPLTDIMLLKLNFSSCNNNCLRSMTTVPPPPFWFINIPFKPFALYFLVFLHGH